MCDAEYKILTYTRVHKLGLLYLELIEYDDNHFISLEVLKKVLKKLEPLGGYMNLYNFDKYPRGGVVFFEIEHLNGQCRAEPCLNIKFLYYALCLCDVQQGMLKRINDIICTGAVEGVKNSFQSLPVVKGLFLK